jgi:hypothetical protein
MTWRDYETFSFGDSPELANELVELVLAGTKRATCWAECQGLLSAEVGKLMVALDGYGVPGRFCEHSSLTNAGSTRLTRHSPLMKGKAIVPYDSGEMRIDDISRVWAGMHPT